MNLKVPYQNFFIKSEEGKAFMAELIRIIDSFHAKAESDGDKARDYSQQAKGVRSIVEHIQSVTTEVKKGKT